MQTMREQPLVIFDGHCGFCRIWVEYWKALTRGRVDYQASQELDSVELVMPGGEVVRGARAVFVTLTYGQVRWPSWAYDRVPGFAPATEAAYRLIASHRSFFYHVTRFTFGKRVQPLKFAQAEWLFLRLLAVIY